MLFITGSKDKLLASALVCVEWQAALAQSRWLTVLHCCFIECKTSLVYGCWWLFVTCAYLGILRRVLNVLLLYVQCSAVNVGDIMCGCEHWNVQATCCKHWAVSQPFSSMFTWVNWCFPRRSLTKPFRLLQHYFETVCPLNGMKCSDAALHDCHCPRG